MATPENESPGGIDDSAAVLWNKALREFYLDGPDATAPKHQRVLHPAAAGPLQHPARRWRDFPLVVFDEETASRLECAAMPLAGLVHRALDEMPSREGHPPALREQVPRLAQAADEILLERDPGAPFRDVFERACERFLAEPESRKVEAILREELDSLRKTLPKGGTFHRLTEHAAAMIHASFVVRRSLAARGRFAEEAKRLGQRLGELLRADAEHAGARGRSPEMSEQLGAAGSAFFDVERMSDLLPEHRGAKRLGEPRRSRIEQVVRELESSLDELARSACLSIVRRDEAIACPTPPGARAVPDAHPWDRAAALADELAGRVTRALRAVRLARLEVAGAYEPARHDAALARFGPDAFSPAELDLVPAVLVVESTQRLLQDDLSAFSRLLSSGKRVQALLTEAPFAAGHWQRLTDHSVSPAYLAVAHRETFVLQSTLAESEHLVSGLERMAAAAGPAVAVVAVPEPTSAVPAWLQLAAALAARATPCLLYDPWAGPGWADRFDLAGNPQLERSWPSHVVRLPRAEQDAGDRDEPFTLAHAVTLEPDCRQHLRIVPRAIWSDDQMELAGFLEAGDAGRGTLPFVWIAGENGELERAIVSRRLTLATLDRMRAWRTYQELARIDRPDPRRAAEAVRREAPSSADLTVQSLRDEQGQRLEQLRGQAAREAMQRLVGVLLDLEPGSPATPATPAVPSGAGATQAPATAPRPAVPAAETPRRETPDSLGPPYIDTVLCTSCNECTNLNPRMFHYDANKQAYIADAAAGTFAELVKAAEKCPARCIHPGAPRPGDRTASPAFVARAAKFG